MTLLKSLQEHTFMLVQCPYERGHVTFVFGIQVTHTLLQYNRLKKDITLLKTR